MNTLKPIILYFQELVYVPKVKPDDVHYYVQPIEDISDKGNQKHVKLLEKQ